VVASTASLWTDPWSGVGIMAELARLAPAEDERVG
jgi:hypothetical protein